MSSRLHRIHIKPAYSIDARKGRSSGHGAFLMTLDDGLEIGTSTEPFFAGARWLLQHKFAEPDDMLETVHAHGTVSMRGTVGHAAKWTISETAAGRLSRRKHQPFPSAENAPAAPDTSVHVGQRSTTPAPVICSQPGAGRARSNQPEQLDLFEMPTAKSVHRSGEGPQNTKLATPSGRKQSPPVCPDFLLSSAPIDFGKDT